MIRVAFLEYEKETKDVVFELAKIFRNTDWTFRHFYKASELARSMKEENYQLFVFDEMFKTPRLESAFVHDNPNAIFIYVCQDPAAVKGDDQRGRVRYVAKDRLVEDIRDLKDIIAEQCAQTDVYTLIYDGVHVNLPYEEIFYVEKMEKMVYFHTKKGVFHKRMNMSETEKEMADYGFLRVHVSYLVNEKHVTAWFKDEVELDTGERIPMSRAQKRKLAARMRREA
ncbi:LytR/AlgR family response regulator transcription factor [Catenisphaera adipataccumulans]|jgi:DNA-binding LytR/AlgR family response regulator|uniref:DNA-binding LytR/AlgR family response regulator n=1 Tax=Catenisphaera adipataccumulans TaxID=700500 RepID=A0A7W8CY64_9FIRM|nr:LytTR family DNA-binding domain-containing protein [Catenisphaera adipataccumulans]MBB5183777.1 DNA-binding LytR/AlgR family response regulator [Catenisphaera adipataccumulans]